MKMIKDVEIIGNVIIITNENNEKNGMPITIENIDRIRKLYYLENEDVLNNKKKLTVKYNNALKKSENYKKGFYIALPLLSFAFIFCFVGPAFFPAIPKIIFSIGAITSFVSVCASVPVGLAFNTFKDNAEYELECVNEIENNIKKLDKKKIKLVEQNNDVYSYNKARMIAGELSLEKTMDDKISSIENYKVFIKETNEKGW